MKIRLILLAATLFIAFTASAQYSPFKPLTKQVIEKYGLRLSAKYGAASPAIPATITAWRFDAPMAVYVFTSAGSALGTAASFGWHKEKYDTATAAYQTTVSITGAIIGAGNVTPNPTQPSSIMTVAGLVGFYKGLIHLGVGYNLPSNFLGTNTSLPPSKGAFAFVGAISIPL